MHKTEEPDVFDELAESYPYELVRLDKEGCRHFGTHHRTVANLLSQGRGPKVVKIGRRNFSPKKDFVEWLRGRTLIVAAGREVD